jgi:4-hydroxy-tetrahydrodipicolinate synthase
MAQRGIIASSALRKPGSKLTALDLADIERLIRRQERRLKEIAA